MFFALIDEDDESLYKTGFNKVSYLKKDYDVIGLCHNTNELTEYYAGCTKFIRVVIVPHDVNIQYKDEYVKLDKVILGEKYPLYDVKTIKKFNLIIDDEYIIWACLGSCLEILEFLYNKNDNRINSLMSKSKIFDWVSSRNNVKILEWWKNSRLPMNYTDASLRLASRNGHIHVLDWWFKSGLELKYTEQALDEASANGHVEVLTWWLKSKLPLKYSERALDDASANGHVEVLTWWLKSKLPLKYSEGALDKASFVGHVDVLDWWLKSGLELKYNENALQYASKGKKSKGKNINILEWLKNSKLPF
jgi:hypothetical protein